MSTSPSTPKSIALNILVSSLSQCKKRYTLPENDIFFIKMFSAIIVILLFIFTVVNEYNENNTRRRKLLVVVTEWIDPGSMAVAIEEFARWVISGNTENGRFYERRLKCKLEPFLPIFIKNSKLHVTFTDKSNKTILHYCILYMKNSTAVTKTEELCDKKLVTALCEREASIIADDCDGNSPLGLALMKKRMDLVDVLLSMSETEFNNRGQTILHVLIDNFKSNSIHHQTYFEYIRCLINRGKDLDKQDNDGWTPVHLAAKSLDLTLLKFFKKHEAGFHFRTNIGDDMLILVCKNFTKQFDESKARNVMHWLLVQGFKGYSTNKHNFTPIHYASQSNHLTVIQALVAAGADIHAIADDNTNPLHSAAMSSSFEVMQYFVKRNVDLHRRDNFYGFSLIHMSAFSYSDKNLRWLITKGFDINDRGNCDLTPLQLAAMVGNVGIVKTLIRLGANVHYKEQTCGCTALHLASMGGNFAPFIQQVNTTRLSGKDANVNTSLVSHCFNSLRYKECSKANYKATIGVLLDAGLDVNAKDNCSRTPLHYATQQSINKLVEDLIISGAYIDLIDAEGYTPLHNCLINANVKGLQSLLIFGADINDIEHPSESIYEKIRFSENTTDYYVLKHLIKLNVAGLHINGIYKSYLSYCEIEDYEMKCLDELSKMKEYMITPDLSLYNLLRANLHFKHRAKLADSLPCNIEIKFPCYYVLITGRCNEGVNQVSLIESAKTAFISLTRLHWPNICSEYILSFLDNNILRDLIASIKVNTSSQ